MRKGFMLLLTAVLLLGMCATAFAHDVPDLSRRGTLNIVMRFDGIAVGGGTLTAYRVGEVHEDDGNYSFVPTERFAASGAVLEQVDSAQLAADLAGFASDKKLEGVTKDIGSDGKVTFESLELGLYLLVQETAASGYSKVAPFLVSVPMMQEGAYIYEVDASPKVELKKAPATNPPSNTDSKLPQTGQLNWPVPVMAATGVGLFTCGWTLCFHHRKEKHA